MCPRSYGVITTERATTNSANQPSQPGGARLSANMFTRMILVEIDVKDNRYERTIAVEIGVVPPT